LTPKRYNSAVWRSLLLLPLAFCLYPQGAHDAVPDMAIGRRIFDSQCALCHGLDGSGGRGPSLRKPKLRQAPDDEALRKVIADGLPPEMPGAWQLSVREVASVAAYVRSLGKVAAEKLPGDPETGRALFSKYGCGSCHIVNGLGGGPGPELSTIGDRRSAAYLRESIVRPSAAVPDGFLLIEVTDSAGRTFTGIKANEDLFTIQLAMPDGRFQSFRKSSLRRLTRLPGRSSMPVFDSMPQADLDHLVAYLASLRGTE
jgi:cytochrome c oxidase cbb3-type subunit III